MSLSVETHMQMAIWLIYGMIVCIAALVLVISAMKLRQIRLQKKTAASLERLQGYFTYVQAQAEDEDRLRPPNFQLNRLEKKVLQNVLVEWIERFTGTHREKLTALCEDLGFVEHQMKRLRSPLLRVRLDAAYHLGMMRTARAVPQLFRLLDQIEVDSSAFIVARSIARSTQSAAELKDLIQYLLPRRVGIHPLLVDMIKESSVDDVPMLTRFLKGKDMQLVKLALIGLSDHPDPAAAPYAGRYIQSADEEIRSHALRLQMNAGALSPGEVRKLMDHQDWKVRAMTAEWIGRANMEECVGVLRQAMTDPHQEVSRKAAESLLEFGEDGFEMLCEAASTESRQMRTGPAMALIQQELEKGKDTWDTLEELTLFNSRLYIYEKFFGKSREYVQVG